MPNNHPDIRTDIRNIAIIAHVDHGKTTLVDGMIRQSHVFRDNQVIQERLMDSFDLERERGITIMAKNLAVVYQGVKINILDTPGHVDFGGEVERVLTMVDGVLLLVDALEGPMPQTRFVLQKAMQLGLPAIVVINKIDRPDARLQEALNATYDLFIDLGADEHQLEFPVLFVNSRDGSAALSADAPGTDLVPLFEAILSYIPAPVAQVDQPLQMLVASLAYDNYKGKIAIGRLVRGKIRPAQTVARILHDGTRTRAKVAEVFTYVGLNRVSIAEASAGDIVAVTGLDPIYIGETITDVENPEALPVILVEEPTLKTTFGVNTSPFAGLEGTWSTSQKLRERLWKELETNVALRVAETTSANEFLVSGRGELHLAILIETIRREGYEFQVSKPEVITKTIAGQTCEPLELLVVDIPAEYIGTVIEQIGQRFGQMTDLVNHDNGYARLEFTVPTRGLIGFRNLFLTETQGRGVMNTILAGYAPWHGELCNLRRGVLIAKEAGEATNFGLHNAENRGTLFITPGVRVYGGMIVGEHPREGDLVVNVCKKRKLTNVRRSFKEITVRLSPPRELSLEQCLDFIAEDELLEVTPKALRLRKRTLSSQERHRQLYGRGRQTEMEAE
ncbi:MAG: translational GTPase TypA [Chloroflexi bacterium]|nr:translational GTPase TypA [Chloroflexota bacterium]MBU1751926.1 translational GTPase TypA [Chloroflexota bacterium]MBU1877564.1 translational GTPase TypA [Chloroflexota bacterium]